MYKLQLTIIPRYPMKPKAEWAIDSEATRARRIIVLVKSKYFLKNIENKKNLAS